ncbi:MAG: hypothetical protein ACRCUP_07010 [Mycoplasmatales bacterium]
MKKTFITINVIISVCCFLGIVIIQNINNFVANTQNTYSLTTNLVVENKAQTLNEISQESDAEFYSVITKIGEPIVIYNSTNTCAKASFEELFNMTNFLNVSTSCMNDDFSKEYRETSTKNLILKTTDPEKVASLMKTKFTVEKIEPFGINIETVFWALYFLIGIILFLTVLVVIFIILILNKESKKTALLKILGWDFKKNIKVFFESIIYKNMLISLCSLLIITIITLAFFGINKTNILFGYKALAFSLTVLFFYQLIYIIFYTIFFKTTKPISALNGKAKGFASGFMLGITKFINKVILLNSIIIIIYTIIFGIPLIKISAEWNKFDSYYKTEFEAGTIVQQAAEKTQNKLQIELSKNVTNFSYIEPEYLLDINYNQQGDLIQRGKCESFSDENCNIKAINSNINFLKRYNPNIITKYEAKLTGNTFFLPSFLEKNEEQIKILFDKYVNQLKTEDLIIDTKYKIEYYEENINQYFYKLSQNPLDFNYDKYFVQNPIYILFDATNYTEKLYSYFVGEGFFISTDIEEEAKILSQKLTATSDLITTKNSFNHFGSEYSLIFKIIFGLLVAGLFLLGFVSIMSKKMIGLEMEIIFATKGEKLLVKRLTGKSLFNCYKELFSLDTFVLGLFGLLFAVISYLIGVFLIFICVYTLISFQYFYLIIKAIKKFESINIIRKLKGGV